MPAIKTPLRYPGGKTCLAAFFERLVSANQLEGGVYAEPYCGGAGVAVELLLSGAVQRVHINDADPAIAAFWRAVILKNDELCARINEAPLTVAEWRRQREVFVRRHDRRLSDVTLGFAAFFLNRTNRSGILNGGVIGGKDQKGPWTIEARFNRSELIQRIQRISAVKDGMRVHQEDAIAFLRRVGTRLGRKALVYLDPPYFNKGPSLYLNYYKKADHEKIADFLRRSSLNWVVTYDNAPEILSLYQSHRSSRYSLSYSALRRRIGSEVMIFAPSLLVPPGSIPITVTKRRARRARKQLVA